MKRISEAIEDIVSNHSALGFGFYHDLLNLTHVARFLKPSIEAITKKEVTESSILMNLSRLRKKLAQRPAAIDEKLILDKVSIQSGLCSATVSKTSTSHQEINQIFNRIQSCNGFITVTEGLREVTVIIESENLSLLTESFQSKARIFHQNLASLGITFSKRYLEVKGILHQLLEEIALHNINIVEIASTATELTIFLHEEDAQLAFEAIFQRFSRRKATSSNQTNQSKEQKL